MVLDRLPFFCAHDLALPRGTHPSTTMHGRADTHHHLALGRSGPSSSPETPCNMLFLSYLVLCCYSLPPPPLPWPQLRKEHARSFATSSRFKPDATNGNLALVVPSIAEDGARDGLPLMYRVNTNTRTVFHSHDQFYQPKEGISEFVADRHHTASCVTAQPHMAMNQLAPTDTRIRKSVSRGTACGGRSPCICALSSSQGGDGVRGGARGPPGWDTQHLTFPSMPSGSAAFWKVPVPHCLAGAHHTPSREPRLPPPTPHTIPAQAPAYDPGIGPGHYNTDPTGALMTGTLTIKRGEVHHVVAYARDPTKPSSCFTSPER